MSRRTFKVAEAIRQVVATAILFEMRDPRVKNVTVLSVEVPVDLQTAKVNVSVRGDEKMAKLSLKGLEAARGWIQSRIAEELDLRWTPILTFILDEGLKKGLTTTQILDQLSAERGETPAEVSVEEDFDSDGEDLDEDEDENPTAEGDTPAEAVVPAAETQAPESPARAFDAATAG